MGNTLIVFVALLSTPALADGISGRTADGCTYKVINGQYLTYCPGRPGVAKAAPTPVANDSFRTVTAAPVTSYDSVPVRHNAQAPVPSVQNVQVPTPTQSSIVRENGEDVELDRETRHQEVLRKSLLDKTFVGVNLGSTTFKESSAGSTLGFGLTLATNIDDTWGVQLGYAYASQAMNLGLGTRGDPSLAPVNYGSTDSNLTANLITVEMQAHLTDPEKRLRPYLGAGLGWQSSTLAENTVQDPNLGTVGGGSLHQSSFGALGTAGAKLRLTNSVQANFAFQYFAPVIRQTSRLDQPASQQSNGSTTSRLTADDDLQTGSAQYQILGGLQYAF